MRLSSRTRTSLNARSARALLALWIGILPGPGSAAHATEVPLWLGPSRPAAPANWTAQSCKPPTNTLERAVWRIVTQNGKLADLSCGNHFESYLRTPQDQGTPLDAFQITAQQIAGARTEVLLTSMEWHAGPGHPGWLVAQALAQLYSKVKGDPAAYPQGMTVRLLLGGYPDLRRPDGASQVLSVQRDLLALGVPLSDLKLGWQVTLLNYRYFPHSHVKLHVIDGRDVTVAGYNFTDWHQPAASPGGMNLHDLGLQVTGPVAQAGVAAFDDLWRHSQQLHCPADVTLADFTTRCALGEADPVHHPPVSQQAVVSGEARAFLLYRRTSGENQADQAHLALLGAATRQIDLMQSDFSPMPYCWLAYADPEPCPPETWPVYLRAVLGALERGVRVRVLTVSYGPGKPGNRSGVALMRREARKRGLEHLFQARYTTFNMHTKALTVDSEMVVVGSMNFHFSAWGQWGLAETALATSDPQAVAEQQTSFEDWWRTSSREVPWEPWQWPGDLKP